jgi:pyrophosphatase PpaX
MPCGLPPFDFDAALFDVDGTLVDSMEMIVRGLGDTYERFARVRPSREAILGQIGIPLRRQVQLYLDDEPSLNQIDEMTRFAIDRFRVHEEYERTLPEAIEMLRLCHRQGLRTALVTSKTSIELTDFLARFSGAPYVHATVCASDVHQPKPHPESALKACQLLGVAPNRTFMVGDSVFDLQCAKQAGLTAVAVTYGAGHRETLLREEPDAMFETPKQLLGWAETAFLETSCRERS